MPRAFSAGEPCYRHRLTIRQPEELLNYCAALTFDDLNKSGQLGRMWFEKFHSMNFFTKCSMMLLTTIPSLALYLTFLLKPMSGRYGWSTM